MCSYASLPKKRLILWPLSPLARSSDTSVLSLHIQNKSVLPLYFIQLVERSGSFDFLLQKCDLLGA